MVITYNYYSIHTLTQAVLQWRPETVNLPRDVTPHHCWEQLFQSGCTCYSILHGAHDYLNSTKQLLST